MMSNPTVPRSWPGSTVACIASGPSLTPADVDYCRGKVRVIAINDGVRLAPWADVLYSSDRRWYPHYRGVPSFTGPKYGIGSTVGKRNPFHQYPEIVVLKNTGYDGLDLDPSGLRNGKNSGYAAINLAVHFGATRIVLLGYTLGAPGGQDHFFGSHPPELPNSSGHHFVTFRRLFQTMVEPLEQAGVEVVNCTPNTSLDAFPVRLLRDALTAAEVAA